MILKRRQKIEALFQEALRVPPENRAAWVYQACDGDPDLRVEVSSLLQSHDPETTVSWTAAAKVELLLRRPLLEAGQHLGRYEVRSFLAEGGMSAVYRAYDPRLQRDVAIKICDEQFSERFSNEV